MIEFTILIPTTRNGDRTPHANLLWDAWHSRLLEFGGFTLHGEVTGQWLDYTGTIITDRSQKYTLAVSSDRERDVYNLIREYRSKFDQECIYVAVTSDDATLLV